MKRVLVFIANGFEEAEAICTIDVLKRANIDVVLAGVEGDLISSTHGIKIKCDSSLDSINYKQFDAFFCPGGMPGALNLAQSWAVNEILVKAYNEGKVISAICASPALVFGPLGLLKGKKATCFPGCESYSPDVVFSSDGVVVDGRIITAKAAGFAFDLGLKLVEVLIGKSTSDKIKANIYYK